MRQSALAIGLVFSALAQPAPAQDAKATSLLEARKGHSTKLTRKVSDGEPLTPPPAALFSLVQYPAPLGKVSAYVSKPMESGKRYPAMVWITGGFPPGGIGPSAWEPADPANDQSAKAYRLAGMIMVYPTVRGSCGNAGVQECFYGEVDDVLAALSYVQGLPYVDPQRIYLGGHSTGGTLALLVAAATDAFKAVISFGPVEDPATYGAESLTYDPADARESHLRAPIHYLGAIRSPTFVIAGTDGNIASLKALNKANTNDKVKFIPALGADHFEILAPVNRLLAKRIMGLSGAEQLSVKRMDVWQAIIDQRTALREADDLDVLASLRRDGVDLSAEHTVQHFLLDHAEGALTNAAKASKAKGFEALPLLHRTDRSGRPYFVLELRKRLRLDALPQVFATSLAVEDLAKDGDLVYQGWTIAP